MKRLWLTRYRPIALALLVGMVMTALVHAWLAHEVRGYIQRDFDTTAKLVGHRIESRVKSQLGLLRGVQSLFLANPKLDRRSFGTLMTQLNLEDRYPGFVAAVFVRAVPKDQLDAFTAAVAESTVGTLYPPFKLQPPGPTDPLYIHDYLFPLNARSGLYFGLNVATVPETRAAIEYGRDHNTGLISTPLPLRGLAGEPLGYVLRYPVYLPDRSLATLPARRDAFVGTVSLVFRIDDMVPRVNSHMVGEGATLELWDQGQSAIGAATPPQRLYPVPSAAPNAAQDGFVASQLIDLPGRQWRLTLSGGSTQYIDRYKAEWGLLWGLGIGLSLLIGWVLQRQARSRALALELANEITEDLRAQESQHQRLAQVAESARDLIVSRDIDGRIVYANQTARQAFEHLGKPLAGLTEPLFSSAELADAEQELVMNGELTPPGGEPRYFELSIQPLTDAVGRRVGSALFAHDISHRHQLDAQARTNDARFADLIELAHAWFWEQDDQFRFTFISGSFLRRAGIEPRDLIGRTRWDLGQGGLSEREWFEFRQLVSEHKPFQDFTYLLSIGAKPTLVSVSGKPVFDEHNVFLGYRGIGYDITAIRAAEMQAHSERQKIEAILDSIGDGVITADLQGRIEYLNPVAAALIGWQPEEALGRPIDRIFQTVDEATGLPSPPLLLETLANAHETGPMQRRSLLLNKFGLTLVIQESATPLRDVQGELVGGVLVFRDVSDWWARVGQTDTAATK
ncbi:CHASE domain-containing protein [Andreprevotia chitinilytica]|uniref:CHASE domain-containing protein n=1 Tax=Andreprevotia chitinilytica TaxID=396808 RepID=UPI00055235D5|nr:PAS domain-containing protein [Andreprevotia chitinilytica]